MDPDFIQPLAALALLLFAFFTGEWVERRHYASIRSRERRWSKVPALSFREVPSGWNVQEGRLVTSSVVISVDHFKRFLAGLRSFFGGRVTSYESLMDRARREALLRLKQAAMDQGYHAIINVRLDTANISTSFRQGKTVAGVEVFAHGTALKLDRRPA